MKIERFIQRISDLGVDCYTGVPDSQLSSLCDYLLEEFGLGNQKHIVAANEGGAVALAAGHYLATGHPALVYLQNSGIGNIINPVCSLIHSEVYAIPVVFVVGWRGQPQTKDEPQHVFQGKVTRELLKCVEIDNVVIAAETSDEEFEAMLAECSEHLKAQRPFAFVVSKGAFEEYKKKKAHRDYPLSREQAVKIVTDFDEGNSFYVSTTGKLSRELFEVRKRNGQAHEKDFLTVGSMGHSIMIALGIASAHPQRQIFCLDGDGAAIMHMGSAAIAASSGSKNLVHLVFNNSAHESVGGIPTVGEKLDFVALARAMGYKTACRAEDEESLKQALREATVGTGPHFIEVVINLEVRKDLGRPTTPPLENRDAFMKQLQTRE